MSMSDSRVRQMAVGTAHQSYTDALRRSKFPEAHPDMTSFAAAVLAQVSAKDEDRVIAFARALREDNT